MSRLSFVLIPSLLALVGFVVSGCASKCEGGEDAEYRRAIDFGKKGFQEVITFVSLVPNAEHNISYFDETAGNPRWISKGLLYDRYVVRMEFDVQRTRSGGKLLSKTEIPQVRITEIPRVNILADGRVGLESGSASPSMSLDDLAYVLDGKKEIAVLGFTLIRNQPVTGLREHWRAG